MYVKVQGLHVYEQYRSCFDHPTERELRQKSCTWWEWSLLFPGTDLFLAFAHAAPRDKHTHNPMQVIRWLSAATVAGWVLAAHGLADDSTQQTVLRVTPKFEDKRVAIVGEPFISSCSLVFLPSQC